MTDLNGNNQGNGDNKEVEKMLFDLVSDAECTKRKGKRWIEGYGKNTKGEDLGMCVYPDAPNQVN